MLHTGVIANSNNTRNAGHVKSFAAMVHNVNSYNRTLCLNVWSFDSRVSQVRESTLLFTKKIAYC